MPGQLLLMDHDKLSYKLKLHIHVTNAFQCINAVLADVILYPDIMNVLHDDLGVNQMNSYMLH